MNYSYTIYEETKQEEIYQALLEIGTTFRTVDKRFIPNKQPKILFEGVINKLKDDAVIVEMAKNFLPENIFTKLTARELTTYVLMMYCGITATSQPFAFELTDYYSQKQLYILKKPQTIEELISPIFGHNKNTKATILKKLALTNNVITLLPKETFPYTTTTTYYQANDMAMEMWGLLKQSITQQHY